MNGKLCCFLKIYLVVIPFALFWYGMELLYYYIYNYPALAINFDPFYLILNPYMAFGEVLFCFAIPLTILIHKKHSIFRSWNT